MLQIIYNNTMKTLTLTKEQLNQLAPTSLLWCQSDYDDLYCWDFSRYNRLDAQELEDSKAQVIAQGFAGDYPVPGNLDNYFIYHFVWSNGAANANNARVITFHEGEFKEVLI